MEKVELKIYCLGGPLLTTEWASILGDKYRSHLNFALTIVSTPDEAEVIVWDGMISPKNSVIIHNLIEKYSEKCVFLITGEAETFFGNDSFVRFEMPENSVYLPPSEILPEDILGALLKCREKVTHV